MLSHRPCFFSFYCIVIGIASETMTIVLMILILVPTTNCIRNKDDIFFDTVTDTSTYYDSRTNNVCCCWWWSYYYPFATVANNPTVYAYLPSSTPIQILIRFVSIDSVSTVIMIIPVPTDVVSSYFKLISIHIWWSYVFDYGTGRVLHSLRLHGTIKS